MTAKAVGATSAGLRHVPVGTRVFAEGPYGAFTAAQRAREDTLLIAGGVGITPFFAHVAELRAMEVPYELHYAVRSREHATFVDELRALIGERLHLYVSEEGSAIDFAALLGEDPNRTVVFYCGYVKCPRSHNAALWARKKGFTNAVRFPGGIDAWKGAGYPLAAE